MPIVLIGIDDTDNDTSPGTGRLARNLNVELAGSGVQSLGITRHQFLVDPRIPYTSHNSGACIAINWPTEISNLKFAIDLIQQWSAEGSDPGICITEQSKVPQSVKDWGHAAREKILTMDDAISLANKNNIQLKPLGGTGQGIIGALAAVGLRADGNEGRFLDLPGLRDLPNLATEKEINRLGITIQHQGDGNPHAPCRTNHWVRPRLVAGKPLWLVQWNPQHHEWISVDQRKVHPGNGNFAVDDG
jgi:hypothetical protein